MYALIRDKDGTFYGSAVFAILKNNENPFPNKSLYFCVVLDKTKCKLVTQDIWDNNEDGLMVSVLLVDNDKEGWNMIDENVGYSPQLPKEKLKMLFRNVTVTPETVQACIAKDASYVYDDFPEIRTEKDVDRFYNATSCLHDFSITKIENKKKSDTLIVHMEGIWGCDVKLHFIGDVKYNLGNLNPKKNELRDWLDCSVLFDEGYVYLVSDYLNDVKDIEDNMCFFRAKRMKYRIIPK